jgi:SnoaL-like domain
MSQENVDRTLELIDAFNRRDLDAFTALTHVQIDVDSGLVAMKGDSHGQGLRRGWESFLGAFRDYNLEVEELRDLGDVTLAQMRGWGHGADSATPLVDFVWIPMRWRDGKLIWWRNCSTEADALAAMGLSE